MRGALTRIGDTFDRLTGRRWIPSSSLATSELVERMKKLLDTEAKEVPGKGLVVPHNIKLKMQWDKFSTDADDALARLERELLTAAIDHINDSLYYTYAPIRVEVKPDYFTQGVKLFASFEKFSGDESDAEVNVTVPAINIKKEIEEAGMTPSPDRETFIARFELKGSRKDRRLEFPAGGRLAVGRTGMNDLVIDDISVSKIHASLICDAEGHLSVADTGSTNGTFINGQRIAYGKATRLVEGDRVKFGTVGVVFEHVPRPVEVEAVAAAANEEEEAVEIGGFEFKRGVSPESPVDKSPDVSIPDETLKIDEVQPGASNDDTIKVESSPQKQDGEIETKAEVSE